MSDDLPDPPVPPAHAQSTSAATPDVSASEKRDPDAAAAVPPPIDRVEPGNGARPELPGDNDSDDPLSLSDGIEADVGAFADDGVDRDTAILLRDRGASVSDDWQDYLIDPVPLPGEIAAEDAGAFENCLDALQRRRLLLICHAPTPSAEARATAALRKAVSELLRREPRCSSLSSRHDRPFAPQNLARTPQWRRDRLRSVIYLFRSDSADSLDFFNRQIEPVRHLCRTLSDNDSYLLLTIALPDTASLCEEALLSREVVLWRLRDTSSVPTEAPITLVDGFDATLVACAALFPGLGFREFGVLVDTLIPAFDEFAEPKADARSRAARWHAGERDAVRAELHVVLRAPHTLDDVATADAGAEPGMYLDTRGRRVDMPEWLYERHPSVLDHMAEVLAERYFSDVTTARFGPAYRRLVLRLDALGIRRLDNDWIVRQLDAALREHRMPLAIRRLDELLREAIAGGDSNRFAPECVTAVASRLAACEARLVDMLQTTGLLEELISQRRVPYAPTFWNLVNARQRRESHLVNVSRSQGSVIELLLGQSFLDPAATVATLAKHMDECGAVHLGWLSKARLRRGSQTPFPFARNVLRNTLARLLAGSPDRWLGFADAVIAQCDPTIRGDQTVHSGRRLARDFVSALAMNCDELMSGASPSELYRALLEGTPRRRFADTLAGLFAVTSPVENAGVREAASVDLPAALLIYQSLTQSLLRHHADPSEPVGDAVAMLSGAWVTTLRREQQIRIAQIVREQLQKLKDIRASHVGDARLLRRANESVGALQQLVRSWQHPGHSAASGVAAGHSPLPRRPLS